MIGIVNCPYCAARVSAPQEVCANCGADIGQLWAVLPSHERLKDDQGRIYRIERVLGQGGFGITYLVRGERRARGLYAVKEFFPDSVVRRQAKTVQARAGLESEFESLKTRFLLEAEILQKLKHPSSTKFHAVWQEHNTVYLAMEFIQGETLESRIASRRLLTEAETLVVLEPVLEVLEELHGFGLLHRDIKPSNVMLVGNHVELIDFGSAVVFKSGQATKVSRKLITPEFAPLEFYGSNVELGPPSDLYSLGATIYEAVSGVRIPAALERMNGQVLQPLEAIMPGGVTRQFSKKLIMPALQMRMADRFASAHEMLETVRRLRARDGFAATPTIITSPAPTASAKPSAPVDDCGHARGPDDRGGCVGVDERTIRAWSSPVRGARNDDRHRMLVVVRNDSRRVMC
jgi:serine/threonine protein kinase